MEQLPRVCIIGAGCSGMTVAKSLKEAGIPFDVYEKGSDVGGLWRFKNDNGMSCIYRSLHINTHRDRMEYRDYPMPESYPDYPGHELIWKYFDDYSRRFDLRKHIHFKTGVERCRQLDDGAWEVKLDNGRIRYYDAVVVANGHHWSPRYPEPYPGKFKGEELHAHYYIDEENPAKLRGKKVMVVGMGNSAMDIAVEISRPGIADRVILSGRRGAYVWPKYIFGKPFDKLTDVFPPWLPFRVKQIAATLVYRLAVGKMQSFGLPAPDHRLGEAHPTISNEILGRLGSGDIVYRPGIAEMQGKRVRFVDGSVEDVDVIIWCTGYNVKFPFLDYDLAPVENNHLPLFHRMYPPEIKGLFFIGLLQPLGAVMPLSEAQGKWLAAYLKGDYSLPDSETMWKIMRRYERDMNKRYVASARHTMQVDFELYLWELERELRRGQKRAAAAQKTLPIAARAHLHGGGGGRSIARKKGGARRSGGARVAAAAR